MDDADNSNNGRHRVVTSLSSHHSVRSKTTEHDFYHYESKTKEEEENDKEKEKNFSPYLHPAVVVRKMWMKNQPFQLEINYNSQQQQSRPCNQYRWLCTMNNNKM